MLREDLEDLLQERRIPQKSQAQLIDYYRDSPEEIKEQLDAIDGYYAYMETVGYKLAHYMGFLFGNQFFPKVIPGYTEDRVCTFLYTGMMADVLEMDIEKFLKIF